MTVSARDLRLSKRARGADSKPRGAGPLAWLLLIALVGLLCALGVWQLSRAADSQAELAGGASAILTNPSAQRLQDALATHRWQAVAFDALWLGSEAVWLDNRTHEGRAGYELLLPARLQDGRFIVVNLGWVAGSTDRRELPRLTLPVAPLRLQGLVGTPRETFTLSADSVDAAARVQRIDTAQLARIWDLPLSPRVFWQASALTPDLVPRVPTVYLSPARHMGYAVQWFALALVLALLGYRLFRSEAANAKK
ncbi:SURF1 family protein [Granulosicoccaceae sp. 1_MG-2023]|nr:SURF1 family protein [Granulosicoccaceae sp. 1_MG-2023]